MYEDFGFWMFAKSIDGQMMDRRILQVHYYAWSNLMVCIMSEASIESLTANRYRPIFTTRFV